MYDINEYIIVKEFKSSRDVAHTAKDGVHVDFILRVNAALPHNLQVSRKSLKAFWNTPASPRGQVQKTR